MTTNWAWKNFKKLGKDTAECQIKGCNKILKVASGPSGLVKHLSTQHNINDPKRKIEEVSPFDEFFDSSASTSQPPKRQKTILECIDYFIDYVQPTSTQSERNFSIAGGIVTKTRTNLADETVDMFCFLKSYFVNREK